MSLLNSLLLFPLLLLVRFLFPAFNFAPTQSLVTASSSSPGLGQSSSTSSSNLKPVWKDPKAKLDDSQIQQLLSNNVEDFQLFNSTLDKILVPRVVGTPSHAKVRQFIVDYLENLGWTVEQDVFKDATPFGEKSFTNIIGTLNPNACNQVVLSCHYDSKYFADFEFLAATDSAVPCAMILELIRILDPKLKALQLQNSNDAFPSLQVIFFDGEEAFEDWSRTDSLYGSRHLAAKFQSQKPSAGGTSTGCSAKNKLQQIDLFILLDLIGEVSPQFCNHFANTNADFESLTRIEKKLNSLKLLETRQRAGTAYFPKVCRNYWGSVDDDHAPFLERGVPVLHMIATPFPRHWHKVGDNAANLHHPTINNLMKILRLYLMEKFSLLNK